MAEREASTLAQTLANIDRLLERIDGGAAFLALDGVNIGHAVERGRPASAGLILWDARPDGQAKRLLVVADRQIELALQARGPGAGKQRAPEQQIIAKLAGQVGRLVVALQRLLGLADAHLYIAVAVQNIEAPDGGLGHAAIELIEDLFRQLILAVGDLLVGQRHLGLNIVQRRAAFQLGEVGPDSAEHRAQIGRAAAVLAGDLQLALKPFGAADRVEPERALEDPQARLLMAALLGRALLEQQQAAIPVAVAARDLFIGAQLAHPRQNGVRLIFERLDRLGKIGALKLLIGIDHRQHILPAPGRAPHRAGESACCRSP